MPIRYRVDARPSRAAVVARYRAAGWSSAARPRAMHRGLLASDSLLTAWEENRLIGVGNAISDGHLVVFFPHLVVHPEYQTRGVGTELMRRMLRLSEVSAAGPAGRSPHDRVLPPAGVFPGRLDSSDVDLRRTRP